jgi:hypothetical protein
VSFGKISTLHILYLKELRISLSKASSGGKGYQNDILSHVKTSLTSYVPENAFGQTGVNLEFLFLKRPYRHGEPKTPAHFKNWILHGRYRSTIWSVDPGKTDVFVAIDGSSTNPHRVRKTSTKEYYDLCGFNQTTNKRRRWLAINERPL